MAKPPKPLENRRRPKRAVGDTTARAVGDTKPMARDREPAWTLLKEPIVWSVALTSAILFVVLSVLWR